MKTLVGGLMFGLKIQVIYDPKLVTEEDIISNNLVQAYGGKIADN